MTSVSYSVCDQCGAQDDIPGRVYLLSLTELTGRTVGHLCQRCAMESAPNADWTGYDRSA